MGAGHRVALLLNYAPRAWVAGIQIGSENPAGCHIVFLFISNSFVKEGLHRISRGLIFVDDPAHAFAANLAPRVTLIDGDVAYPQPVDGEG